jgi:SAM-dependent methyltransferase
MEPEPTFVEIARILRVGGVFAAVDCDWPPTMNWEVEAAYSAFTKGIDQIDRDRGLSTGVKKWAKSEHLTRMQQSGQFRFTKEIVLNQIETGNADRLIGLAKSMGTIAGLLKNGLTEDEIGLTRLAEVAQRGLGDSEQPWYFSYRVRVGVR